MAQTLEELEAVAGHAGARLVGDATTGPILETMRAGHCLRLSVFGGQILHWQPENQAPVVWLSPGAVLNQSSPIRGGIPVCWPWFAEHRRHGDAWPMHGFARTRRWQLDSAEVSGDNVCLHLRLGVFEADGVYWPQATRPRLEVVAGSELTVSLITENDDDESIRFSEALHTYFAIGDVSEIEIRGLESVGFIDKLAMGDAPRIRSASGDVILVDQEIDRIYRGPEEVILVRDERLGRCIEITQSGARNSVVWNPWQEKTKRLGDMGPTDAYRRMVCIETGNVLPDELVLAPGETHRFEARYRVLNK